MARDQLSYCSEEEAMTRSDWDSRPHVVAVELRRTHRPGDAGWEPDEVARTPDWMVDAACRGMPASLFYPEAGAHNGEAKAVCDRCPVASDCLDHALAAGEKHGMWGGQSERARKSMRSARRCEPGHGTRARYVSPIHRCRCDACTAANTEYARKWKAS